MNSAAAFDACVEAGADWVGFVFFAGSPRWVSPEAAAALSGRSEEGRSEEGRTVGGRTVGGPRRVGLFVDADDATIAAALAAVRLDVLQLYAPAARAAEVAARFGVPVWRSVAVATREDLPATAGAAAALLIEPRAPADAGRPGGLGQALDWGMLDGWRPGFDWVLAGGLAPGNVARAVAQSGARAVDVSSGVETAPGVKSAALIRAFVVAAKEGFSAWGGGGAARLG